MDPVESPLGIDARHAHRGGSDPSGDVLPAGTLQYTQQAAPPRPVRVAGLGSVQHSIRLMAELQGMTTLR